MLILSIAIMLGSCGGTAENGAKKIPRKDGEDKDILQIPPPPNGCVLYSMEVSDGLYITYEDTLKPLISYVTIRYYKISLWADNQEVPYVINFLPVDSGNEALNTKYKGRKENIDLAPKQIKGEE